MAQIIRAVSVTSSPSTSLRRFRCLAACRTDALSEADRLLLNRQRAGSYEGSPGLLRECQIQILDCLVDLRSVLVSDCNAIDTRVLERESHRRLAVLTV